MPAHLLSETRSAVGRFAVVATRDESPPCAVTHVGLLAQAVDLSVGCMAPVHHVAPPLSDDTMPTHAVGWVANLTADQELTIELWLQEVKTRIGDSPTQSSPELAVVLERFPLYIVFRDYIVHPPADVHPAYPKHDPKNGRAYALRFSCAGFIEACYRETLDVSLISHDALPRVDQATLMTLWFDLGRAARLLRTRSGLQRAFLRHLGIAESEDLAVLLPGYLLHALARDDLGTPYKPRAEDRFFPGP